MVGPGLCYRAVPISEVGLVFTLQIIHIDLNLVGNILEPLLPNFHKAKRSHRLRVSIYVTFGDGSWFMVPIGGTKSSKNVYLLAWVLQSSER